MTKTCMYVDAKGVMPGWGCCQCHVYNGLQRPSCRNCKHERCKPLAPDEDTGRVFETYKAAEAAEVS